jgi:hypothetical protein|tara:strand:+ start:126 stop:893 length:768 start_codon:yes stop_codon:yes gene_type:complete
MAARNGATGGRQNYYSVSYGKLSTKVKEAPEDYTEILETELKERTMKCENIDLRRKFVRKSTGDYPIVEFYDAISGTIQSIEKDEYSKGTSLKITITDEDGETSVIQSKFYSKYTENALNRLLSLRKMGVLTFSPYSMPDTYTPEGGDMIKYYNSGISIKMDGEKVTPFYTGATIGDMPPTERVQDAEGKTVTSRVKRVSFLFEEVQKLVIPKVVAAPIAATAQSANSNSSATPINNDPSGKVISPVEADDDLPF